MVAAVTRHEVSLEAVQHSPDGTVTAIRYHELLEDDAAAVGPGDVEWAERRAANHQHQQWLNRVLSAGILGLIALAGVAGAAVGVLT